MRSRSETDWPPSVRWVVSWPSSTVHLDHQSVFDRLGAAILNTQKLLRLLNVVQLFDWTLSAELAVLSQRRRTTV